MASVIVGAADVFDPQFDARVIPVDCQGGTEKGLIQAAASTYPDAVRYYKSYCKLGYLKVGEIVEFAEAPNVWFAATRVFHTYPSRGSWILSCCEAIARMTKDRLALRIVVPALGSRSGRLDWESHREAMKFALGEGRRDVTIYLSPPWNVD